MMVQSWITASSVAHTTSSELGGMFNDISETVQQTRLQELEGMWPAGCFYCSVRSCFYCLRCLMLST